MNGYTNEPAEMRESCPNCGSRSRENRVSVGGKVEVKGQLTGIGRRLGRLFSFRETARQGRTANADKHNDDSMSFSLDGSSPQGEEDTVNACKVLIRALNLRGETWEDPIEGQGIADCIAMDSQQPHRSIIIQVVRAISNPELWKELTQSGHIGDSNVAAGKLAEDLRTSIDLKARADSIPRVSRNDVTLALDATRLPVLAFENVIEEFRASNSSWARKLGFSAIWLVGPTEQMTHRLDL